MGSNITTPVIHFKGNYLINHCFLLQDIYRFDWPDLFMIELEDSNRKSENELNSKYELIWFDRNANPPENILKEETLLNIIICQNLSEAKQKLKEMKRKKVFVIINGDTNYSEEFVNNIHRLNEVAAIYIYSKNVQFLRQLFQPISKVRCVSNNYSIIFLKFEKDLNAYEHLQSLTFVPNFDYTSQRLSTNQFPLIQNWTQLCQTELTDQMKNTLFQTYQNNLNQNQTNLIKQFQKTLEPSTAIYWFTEQPQISRVFYNVCQNGDWNSLEKFEYLIRCLYIQLKEQHQLFNTKSLFYVYRGQLMTSIQFKRLKMQIGKNILLTNFLLANFDKDKVLDYINRCQPSSNQIRFLLKICINPHLKKTQPYSIINSNNERLLLIMLTANFHLLDIILNPHEHIPTVLFQLHNNK